MYLSFKDIHAVLGGSLRPKHVWMEAVPHHIVTPPRGRPFKVFAIPDIVPAIRSGRKNGLSGGEIRRLMAASGTVPDLGSMLSTSYKDPLKSAAALLDCMVSKESERFRAANNEFQRGFTAAFWGRSYRVGTERLRSLLILDPIIFTFVFCDDGYFPVKLLNWEEYAESFVARNASVDEIKRLAQNYKTLEIV